MEQKDKNNNLAIGLLVIAVISALGIGGFVYWNNTRDQSIQSTDQNGSSLTATTTDKRQSSYKDGTYEVVGEYISPGGNESINVNLVLKDGVVTDATVVSNATRPNSVKFQGQFIGGFKDQVIGKNIDEINITKVSGSSLTPKGFMDALNKVKVQAQT